METKMEKMVQENEKEAQLATTIMEVVPLTAIPIATPSTTNTWT